MNRPGPGPVVKLATVAEMLWHDKPLPDGYTRKAYVLVDGANVDWSGYTWPPPGHVASAADRQRWQDETPGQALRVRFTGQGMPLAERRRNAVLLVAVSDGATVTAGMDTGYFTGARVEGVAGLNESIRLHGRSTDLSGMVLSYWDLAGADLAGARLDGADLEGADLDSADLTGASLDGAYLEGADLTEAVLSEALLSRANLDGAALAGADLDGAVCHDTRMSGADLTGAYLRGADLTDANLTDANLEHASLRRAVLAGTVLDGARLHGCRIDDTPANRKAAAGRHTTGTPRWVPERIIP